MPGRVFDGVQLPTKVPSTFGLCPGMGLVDFGFLCNINRQRGLSDRASVSTPALNRSHSYALASKLAQSTDSAIRDQVPGRQTGSGGNLFPTNVTRVVQPHLLGAQEGWRLQTGVQFEAPEQVCRQGEVQNEDTTGYNHSIACRGLGSAHRSHRCLLSCSNSSQVQASTEVRPTDGGQSQGVSVPSSAIRPNIGTPGFYQGDIASGKNCPFTWPALDSVSGRLDHETSVQGQSDTRNRLVEDGHLQSGVGGQRGEIPVCTHTAICSHRHRISSGRGLDLPPPHGQDLEDREFHPSVADIQSDNGSLLAIPARSAKFSSRCHSTRQIAFKASANIFVGTLGTNIKRLESTHSRQARSLTQSPGMVAEPVLHACGNVSGSSRPTKSSFHRCIHFRLACPSRNSVHNGNLDSPRSQVSHQSSGIAGSEICSARISEFTAEKISSTDVGQCHGCGLSSQSRGDKIHPLISRQQRDSPLSSPPAYGPTSQTHSRREECISSLLSRKDKVIHTEWTLKQSVVDDIFGAWETQPRSSSGGRTWIGNSVRSGPCCITER